MFDSPAYDWYNSQASIAKTETGATDKADLRIPSSAHEMVTRCSARLQTNEFKQTDCKWYVEASGLDLKRLA